MQPIFYYDFASPNAYIAHAAIPAIEQRTGAQFKYAPVLLGGVFKLTNNQAPFVTAANVKHKIDYERRDMMRFLQRYGLSSFQFNPHFPVNTLMLMRGAIAAAQLGVENDYIRTGFRAMWEEGRKMDDAIVYAETMRGAGLPADEIVALSQSQQVKDALSANTQAAVDRGVFGIPFFAVGDDMYFGKDRLREVEEALQALRA